MTSGLFLVARVRQLLQHTAECPERRTQLPVAWTPKALAKQTPYTPSAIERVLRKMEKAGEVSSRRDRSGVTLFKLLDRSESRGGISIN